MDFIPSINDFYLRSLLPDKTTSEPQSAREFNEPNHEDSVISYLTLEQYHNTSFWRLSQVHNIPAPRRATVHLGAVLCPSAAQGEEGVEVAFLPDPDISHGKSWGAEGTTMRNGWTR
jgi:hypothetical protein